MTLSRKPDGSVEVSDIDEWHLQTLKNIPVMADPGDDDAALRRLFPAPFAAGDATPEQQEDWVELVQPELESLFADSLALVAADLRTAQPVAEPAPEPEPEPPEPDSVTGNTGEKPAPKRRKRKRKAPPPGPRWQLLIPADHGEAWFRAMNQARLVMSERFEAHRTDRAHLLRMLESGRIEIVMTYEFLTSLCGWWVEAILNGPRD